MDVEFSERDELFCRLSCYELDQIGTSPSFFLSLPPNSSLLLLPASFPWSQNPPLPSLPLLGLLAPYFTTGISSAIVVPLALPHEA